MMFCATTKYHDIESNEINNQFIVPTTVELETEKGWKAIKNIKVGDSIKLSDSIFHEVTDIFKINDKEFNLMLI